MPWHHRGCCCCCCCFFSRSLWLINSWPQWSNEGGEWVWWVACQKRHEEVRWWRRGAKRSFDWRVSELVFWISFFIDVIDIAINACVHISRSGLDFSVIMDMCLWTIQYNNWRTNWPTDCPACRPPCFACTLLTTTVISGTFSNCFSLSRQSRRSWGGGVRWEWCWMRCCIIIILTDGIPSSD